MLTSTNRRLTDELSFLPHSAVTGGIDGDWRLGHEGRYSLTGYWAGSTVRGTPDAIDRIQVNNVHSFQRPRTPATSRRHPLRRGRRSTVMLGSAFVQQE